MAIVYRCQSGMFTDMSQLIDLIAPLEEELPENMFDSDYQANMYLIESAERELGVNTKGTTPVRSPYDTALMKLIESVPIN